MVATLEPIIGDKIESWPLVALRPNPLNPRGEVTVDDVGMQELAASIREQRLLQPLLTTEQGIIIAGHRRLVAASMAGLANVPVIVRNLSEAEQLECMLVENLQRAALTPLQEARGYARLKAMGLTNADVARRLGVQHHRVNRSLLMLRLDPQVQTMIDTAELPLSFIPILCKVVDVERQRRLASLAARQKLTTERLEQLIERGENKPPAVRVRTLSPTSGSRLSRPEAIELLTRQNGRQLSCREMLALFDSTCGVCGTCGLAKAEAICRECPMTQFVARLVRG